MHQLQVAGVLLEMQRCTSHGAGLPIPWHESASSGCFQNACMCVRLQGWVSACVQCCLLQAQLWPCRSHACWLAFAHADRPLLNTQAKAEQRRCPALNAAYPVCVPCKTSQTCLQDPAEIQPIASEQKICPSRGGLHRVISLCVAVQGLPDHIFRDHLLDHPSPANSQDLGESKVNLNDDMWKLLLEVSHLSHCWPDPPLLSHVEAILLHNVGFRCCLIATYPARLLGLSAKPALLFGCA